MPRVKPGSSRGKGKPADPLPKFVAPCLATLYRDVARGDQWVHEIKFDGYRLQARIDDGDVQLLTRTGLDWTGRFGAVAKALKGLKLSSALIDGEVVVEDETGASSFVALVDALKAGRSADMIFYVFDAMHLEGVNVMDATLLDRKALLATVLDRVPKRGTLRYSEHIDGDGMALFKEACKLGLEGIISKRKDLPYRSGRRDEWRKAKCAHEDEFVIGGYVDHSAINKAVGSLALGYFEKGQFVYAGRVGTGFTQASAHGLWKMLQPLRVPSQPFAKPLNALQRKDVKWVRPQLVAQIEYRAWSSDGLLRHSAFKALREDKPASKVARPLRRNPTKRDAALSLVGGSDQSGRHLGRIGRARDVAVCRVRPGPVEGKVAALGTPQADGLIADGYA